MDVIEMKSKVSILVVDDERLVRDLVCMMLSSLGYEATTARSAVDALRRIEDEGEFQLVLTDIHMSQIDGWELARRIKALQPYLPIVALTGEPSFLILPKLAGSAISHALFKPVRMDSLRDAIAGILESEQVKCMRVG